MNSQTISVLLIEDSSDYAELVEQWLASSTAPERFQLHWTDSLAHGLNRLAAGGIDVLLLDLNLPDSDGMATFTSVRDHSDGVPVVVLSAADSEALALRTIQEGAEDYMLKSACNRDALLRAIRYALFRHRAQKRRSSGELPGGARVLGIMGAKGGAGATTVACNLADELAKQTSHRVLLADLDIQCGSVAFVMGMEPKYSALEAFENIDHLDAECWQSIVVKKGKQLDVLASPSSLGLAEPVAATARRLIQQVDPFYRWIVVDLGLPNALSRGVLESLEDLLIVTTSEVSSLYETKRLIDSLIQGGMDRDRCCLVINGGESPSVPTPDLKKMFGIEVKGVLPNAHADLRAACVGERLASENTKFRKDIARLARKIAGLPDASPKGGLARFLNFGGAPQTTKAGKPASRV